MKIEIKYPDNTEFAKLLKSFKEKSLTKFKKELKSKKERIIIVKINGKIAGVLKYKNLKNYSRVESFFLIQKKWRGKGIAQKLYEKYEKSLKSKKFIEAYVYQTDKRAKGFWEKNGFKIIKDSKDNQGEKLYYMKKRLKQIQ